MNEYDLQKYKVDKPEQFTSGRHFAILVFEPYSIYHEGDERSRPGYPGQGYPAYTESGMKTHYYSFNNEGEWKAVLVALQNNVHGYQFRGIVVERVAQLKTTVEVVE